jgi:hypothetical protein
MEILAAETKVLAFVRKPAKTKTVIDYSLIIRRTGTRFSLPWLSYRQLKKLRFIKQICDNKMNVT